jgi:hypothetical protein
MNQWQLVVGLLARTKRMENIGRYLALWRVGHMDNVALIQLSAEHSGLLQGNDHDIGDGDPVLCRVSA